MEPDRARSIHRALAQIARVVHTAVRRRIELDDVQIRGAGPDAPAGVAFPARLPGAGGAALAIERHSEDPSGRRLANAPRPGEQVAVRHPALGHGSAQGGGHVILHDEIAELLGAVLASEGNH